MRRKYACSPLRSWLPTALQCAWPTPAGRRRGVKTDLRVGWPSSLPPHLGFCGDLLVPKSLRNLQENPHMVVAGLCLLQAQEPQEELDRNPGILGPACPQLVDQDPTRETGKPMRAGPFLSEVEVSFSPWVPARDLGSSRRSQASKVRLERGGPVPQPQSSVSQGRAVGRGRGCSQVTAAVPTSSH